MFELYKLILIFNTPNGILVGFERIDPNCKYMDTWLKNKIKKSMDSYSS
jgi:hypothetical protein